MPDRGQMLEESRVMEEKRGQPESAAF
jgi:hypothetical protein